MVIVECNERKPVWRRSIEGIFSLRDLCKRDIEQAISHRPTSKFTAEILDTEVIFLDTVIQNGKRFKEHSVLDIKTHLKLTATFQYTDFTSCHPPNVKKGFVKGEALRLLRTNSSKTCLLARGYPHNLIEKVLSEIKFTERSLGLTQGNKNSKDVLPVLTKYEPSMPKIKQVFNGKCT